MTPSRFRPYLWFHPAWWLALTVIVGVPALADGTATTQRTVVSLADGVYVIRHKDAPDTFPQGNTTVIIGSRDVLVVDSCYLPSSALEDIAQIRNWTSKPVRFVLNTHWHYDHTMGNATYREAFPGLVVVAHDETRNQIAGYNPGWFERFRGRAERLQKMIDSGKGDAGGKTLTAGEIEGLKTAIAGIEPVWSEFKGLPAHLAELTPDVSFDSEMTIDLGGREVRLAHMGRGNTRGDAVVYLPEDKILIAGDLVDYPVPYFFGGYPEEQMVTLRKLLLLDTQAIVPGHGEILHDKAFVRQELALIESVVLKVKEAVYRLGNGAEKVDLISAEVAKTLNVDALRVQFAGDDRDNRDAFDEAFDGLVRATFAESWGK